MSRRLFVFGLGYTALALARRAAGARAGGSPAPPAAPRSRPALAAAGIEAHLFERGRPLAEPAGRARRHHAIC